jgi:uncharacterized protein (DUF924 family)
LENPASIRDYWFGSHPDDATIARQRSKFWWSRNDDTDQEIRHRFENEVHKAANHALDAWADSPAGLLSLVLLTDQFPRNIFRNTAKAFAFDALAQTWCKIGLDRHLDGKLRPIERVFFYLPLEHSECLDHQEQSVQLFTRLYQEVSAEQMDTFRVFLIFALRHRHVIARFGRFPHRNEMLGRVSTPEEIAFLKEPGSSF